MKKIILIIMGVLLLTGCDFIENENEKKYIQDSSCYYTVIDKISCVEYIKYSCGYQGGLSVRYNANGTIKTNEECLNENNRNIK